MCHMSRVRCQVSGVKCPIFFFSFQFGGASRWRVYYQWGLPIQFFYAAIAEQDTDNFICLFMTKGPNKSTWVCVKLILYITNMKYLSCWIKEKGCSNKRELFLNWICGFITWLMLAPPWPDNARESGNTHNGGRITHRLPTTHILT